MRNGFFISCVCAVLFLGMTIQTVAAASLTPEQKKVFSQAAKEYNLINKQMRRMNVQKDGPATMEKLDGVEKMLLDAGWQKSDQQAAQLFNAVDAARSRLKAAMDKSGGTSPISETASSAKLRYDQQQSLNETKRNLKNVEAGLEKARQSAEDLKAGKTVSQDNLNSSKDALDFANKNMEKVRKYMAKLPAGHPDVKPVSEQVVKVEDTLKEYTGVVFGKVEDTEKEMRKLIADVDGDYARLSRMAESYKDASDRNFADYLNKYDFPKYRQLWADAAMAQENANEMKKKYAIFADKHGGMAETGKKVLTAADGVLQYSPIFEKKIKSAVDEDASKNIPAEMDKVAEMSKTAVSQKNPAFFAGGIPQKMNEISDRIKQLEQAPVVPQQTAGLKEKHKELAKTIDSEKVAMEAQIIAEVRLPSDEYKGADRGEIEKMIREAWAKEYPNEKIELIRFHAANWHNTQCWRWDYAGKAWNWNDTDVLPVKVVVKNSDGKTANVYMAFCNRNNVSKATNAGVQTREGYVVETMLVNNIK